MLLGHCTFILSNLDHFRSGPFLPIFKKLWRNYEGTVMELEFDSKKKTGSRLILLDMMLLGHCTFILSNLGHFRSGPFLPIFKELWRSCEGAVKELEFDSQKKTKNQPILLEMMLLGHCTFI